LMLSTDILEKLGPRRESGESGRRDWRRCNGQVNCGLRIEIRNRIF
jgi:hypothetical protein